MRSLTSHSKHLKKKKKEKKTRKKSISALPLLLGKEWFPARPLSLFNGHKNKWPWKQLYFCKQQALLGLSQRDKRTDVYSHYETLLRPKSGSCRVTRNILPTANCYLGGGMSRDRQHSWKVDSAGFGLVMCFVVKLCQRQQWGDQGGGC